MIVISMLRGINVGGHHLIKMDALRAMYESLGLKRSADLRAKWECSFPNERSESHEAGQAH